MNGKIDRALVLERWEMILAESILKLENDGLFINQTISHSNGNKAIRVHTAYGVFKDAQKELAQFNRWHEETNQLELNL